jgi:hypothetical protein
MPKRLWRQRRSRPKIANHPLKETSCFPPKQVVLLKGQYNMAGSRSGRSGKSGWAGHNVARRAARLAANTQSKKEEDIGRQISTPHPLMLHDVARFQVGRIPQPDVFHPLFWEFRISTSPIGCTLSWGIQIFNVTY